MWMSALPAPPPAHPPAFSLTPSDPNSLVESDDEMNVWRSDLVFREADPLLGEAVGEVYRSGLRSGPTTFTSVGLFTNKQLSFSVFESASVTHDTFPLSCDIDDFSPARS